MKKKISYTNEEEFQSYLSSLYQDSYFSNRDGQDKKRQEQFKLDKNLLFKHVSFGAICDVGCSTGEFLNSLNWEGELYGYEPNENAKKIAQKTIDFSKNIYNSKEFFDVVVLRGVIQHLDEPFNTLKHAFISLKRGGYLIILSTPNTDSILYKKKKNLPSLDAPRNFYIPGHASLLNALSNLGFSHVESNFEYIKSPYSEYIRDHIKFIFNLFSNKFYPHAFWKSMMDVVVKKDN